MDKFIKSPLNYTGGKYKLLSQILPLFPDNVECFYDLFAGGANVCVNVHAKKTFAFDINKNVIELFQYLKKEDLKSLLEQILAVIKHYNLSNTLENGYDFYGCNSSEGLASFNKVGFSALKADYNNPSFENWNKNLLFYVLIIFGFNNQIRFNSKGEFNISTGKRDFNASMRKSLTNFVERIQSIDICFENKSALDIEIKDTSSFVYVDPPYLISVATYNESDGWNLEKEQQLLNYLDNLTLRGETCRV